MVLGMVLIVGISGSPRPGATTLTMVKAILAACQKKGAQTELLDLAQVKLPFFDHRESWDYGAEHKRVQDLLAKADGFVIGSPEYHGSLSGALKNFLDLLDYKRVLAGKPVAFCGVGSMSRARSMLDHALVVARALKMWSVPRTVGANQEDFDQTTWQISNPAILERIEDASDGLIKAVSALRR
jgi:FMN reductase